ncbi:MAG: transcriptional regulator [Rhodospirillales bacterium CG15_BIG_FIL_POST_REV_8_21_14_020_66_15]|nr:MAG: transcriptional regulator [Rhodospirillales bacterium CG15_BIG_FIL_POST_REV_8_21_14_020_66_15]
MQNVERVSADVAGPPLSPGGALDRDRAEEVAAIFHLLGEPNRLAILTACMAGPRSVNDLAALTGMSPSLTSHHLRLLKAARLVRAKRRGKFVHYAVHDHHVTSILRDMIEHVAEPDHGAEEA